MSEGLPDIHTRVRVDTSELSASVGRAAKIGSAIGSAVGNLAAQGIATGVSAVGGFLKGAVDAANESIAIGKTTAAIIKSTGGAAGLTAKQVGDLATAQSGLTGIDDELIQRGENLLLTFKNVRDEAGKGNDVFSQATGLSLDLSKAGFGSVESASKGLGKALNDPIKGISALGRAGVTFTAQQQDQIKAYVEQGNLLGAQKLILKEVASQVGGVAAATATPMDKAKVALGNLQESLGTAVLPMLARLATVFVTDVVPALMSFGSFMADVVAKVRAVVSAIQELVSAAPEPVLRAAAIAAGLFAGALTLQAAASGAAAIASGIATGAAALFATTTNAETGATQRGLVARLAHNVATIASTAAHVAAAVATGVMTAAQWALNAAMSANPIGLVILAIVALVAAFVLAYKNSETFRNIVQAAMRGVVTAFQWVVDKAQAVFGWIRSNWPLLLGVLTGPIGIAVALIAKHWDAIKSGVSDAFHTVVDTVRTGIGTVVDYVRGIPGKITGALGNLGTLLKTAGAELIQGLIDGIMSKLRAVGDAMSSVADKVKGFLPGSPVKEGPLTSWNNGGAGKRLGQLLADGLLASQATVSSAAHQLAGSVGLAGLPGGVSVAGGAGGLSGTPGGSSTWAPSVSVQGVFADPFAAARAAADELTWQARLSGAPV